ncbi:WD40-repeat-containing domain protein [Cerioporus squamosus]|nr:WD40-repeat-containing domain protein [Cerioporus squamosus]
MSDTEIDSSAYVEIHTLAPNHCNTVNALCFSPDGAHLASGGDDSTLNIWNVTQGKLLYRILFEASISRIVWHPIYPDTIIVGCDDGRIFQLYEFSLMSCEQVDVKLGVLGEVHALAYGSAARFLAIGVGEQVHVTREQEQNKYDTSILLPPPAEREDVNAGDRQLCAVSVHFAAEAQQLIVAYLAHGIVCYEIETRRSIWRLLPRNETPNIGSSALSLDGRYIIAHNVQGGVDLYAASARKSRSIMHYNFDEPPRSKHCLQVSFLQRSNGIVCGTTTGNICIWYRSTGELFQKLHHDGMSPFVTRRSSVSYIASGSVEEGQSAQIKIWRAKMSMYAVTNEEVPLSDYQTLVGSRQATRSKTLSSNFWRPSR